MSRLPQPPDTGGGDYQLGTREEGLGTRATASSLAPSPQPLAPLLFDRVSKWYGPVIGVNQVTLELRPGITGLVGANGSGKSTLLRLAAGQLRPELGRVQICGHDAWTPDAKRHVGYCPEQDVFYEDMTGRRFVEAMGLLCGFPRWEVRRRAAEVLELVGMASRCDRVLSGYSKGMRQRIKLAQALLHDPELLLLDEPLSGIDPIGRRESVELFLELARRGKCLLVSSHELEELEKLTDHVAIMSRGRIAAVGPLTQIRDLLDSHPLSIRMSCDDNRKLATLVLAFEDVVGLDRGNDEHLLLRVKNPRRFFAKFNQLVLEENLDVRHLETVDESAHAILGYLLGSGRT